MRVAIIEDMLMFREALRGICRRHGHEVVAETDSGIEGEKLTIRHKPDVLLLDVRLPDIDGLVLAQRLLLAVPALRVLVVSAHCDDYTVFRVQQLGLHGFVDKAANTGDTLAEALVTVHAGQRYYSPSFRAVRSACLKDPRSFTKTLTEWERLILRHIAAGCSDEEIARRVDISPRTVQGHRSNMIRKLNVKGTPKLMAFALEHGLNPPVEAAPRTARPRESGDRQGARSGGPR